MDVPVVRQDQRALGDAVAADNVVLGCGVGQREGRYGVPAVCFLDDGIDVGEFSFVAAVGEAGGADDAVEFFLCFLLDFGEYGHGEEEGHQR